MADPGICVIGEDGDQLRHLELGRSVGDRPGTVRVHLSQKQRDITTDRAPGRTRTYDTRFRKPLLYPLSYGG